jgi:hypothetical protein
MSEPVVRFPVKCPVCDGEVLAEFSVSLIADALLTNEPIPPYAGCHKRLWNASQTERTQIREYLGNAGCVANPVGVQARAE